ncbi:hypothetical protein Q8A73_000478 [Channa argus]|nr:hypothetical protein Q8A73_000478 [Channa argus]
MTPDCLACPLTCFQDMLCSVRLHLQQWHEFKGPGEKRLGGNAVLALDSFSFLPPAHHPHPQPTTLTPSPLTIFPSSPHPPTIFFPTFPHHPPAPPPSVPQCCLASGSDTQYPHCVAKKRSSSGVVRMAGRLITFGLAVALILLLCKIHSLQRNRHKTEPGTAPERGEEEEERQKEESERWRGSEKGIATLFATAFSAQRKRRLVSSCSGAVFRHVKTKDFLSDYIGIDIKQRTVDIDCAGDRPRHISTQLAPVAEKHINWLHWEPRLVTMAKHTGRRRRVETGQRVHVVPLSGEALKRQELKQSENVE